MQETYYIVHVPSRAFQGTYGWGPLADAMPIRSGLESLQLRPEHALVCRRAAVRIERGEMQLCTST